MCFSLFVNFIFLIFRAFRHFQKQTGQGCVEYGFMPPRSALSVQKSLDDLFLRFLFGKSERHQFGKLFARDLADSGFVNKLRVDIVCGKTAAVTEALSMMMASHSVCPWQGALPFIVELKC